MSAKYPFLNLATVNEPFIAEITSATQRVINSGRYIGGQEVEGFESELAAMTGCKYATGTGNGLDALKLIFRAYIELGKLKVGDEVIVPANTYIASVLAVTENGLKPVFVEPSVDTLNLDTKLICKAITERTKAILTVHLYGRICFDQAMIDVARQHNLLIVEDNAQAIGAVSDIAGLNGSHHSGALGHAAGFSFYPTKNIGALGDAGAITTDDEALAKAVTALRNYGSDRLYHNVYAGYNSRLDPMQAAILRVKLPHTDQINSYRRKLAKIYNNTIDNPCVIKPQFDGTQSHVWQQYIVRVKEREDFRDYLLRHGVETAIHYPTPPHRQPCYAQYSNLNLPIADMLGNEVVSLPITACTSEADAKDIALIINSYNQ
jgi:dTDP-4-amino-4,6-dideoxygalactose transaminase